MSQPPNTQSDPSTDGESSDRQPIAQAASTATQKVVGETAAANAAGVVGRTTAGTGVTYGVVGETHSTSDGATGVRGEATATGGAVHGVVAATSSSDAAALHAVGSGGGAIRASRHVSVNDDTQQRTADPIAKGYVSDDASTIVNTANVDGVSWNSNPVTL